MKQKYLEVPCKVSDLYKSLILLFDNMTSHDLTIFLEILVKQQAYTSLTQTRVTQCNNERQTSKTYLGTVND